MENMNGVNITKYIGDFYEGCAKKDRIAMNKALDYIENLIGFGEADSETVRIHFNEFFSGRRAYNTAINVGDYPKESIIRELLQNAFDCCYENRDIKLAVNFKEDNTISISYNETGFTFENFLCYLSFGLNFEQEGREQREGRFGVGAKSVFYNVVYLSMRSNNLSFRIVNEDGGLFIEELELNNPIFEGTELVIKVDSGDYNGIKENFLTLAEKKGEYINIPELCFAFNKKKVLNYNKRNLETKERTFNIAVLEDNKLACFYRIFKFRSKAADAEVIRFMKNNKNVVDFICEEERGMVYLIPFAVSCAAKEGVLRVLGAGYNYFSTYELTGHIKDAEVSADGEKLSSFFISVPNKHITSFRTGIRRDSEKEIKKAVEFDMSRIIVKYAPYFVLLVTPLADKSGYCCMRPDSYAFEFIKNFLMTSRFTADLRNEFQSGISILFKNESEAVPYTELIKTAFSSKITGISADSHLCGAAYREHIENELKKMREMTGEAKTASLYASYTWENDGGVTGTVFRYEFYRNGRVYVIDSVKNPDSEDFNLHQHFPSVTGVIVKDKLGGSGTIADENVFISLIKLFDERYDGKYKITAKTPVLSICFGEEEYSLSLANMRINNIAAVMDTLAAHRYRFDSVAAFSEAEKMFMSIFCGDGSAADLLKGIAACGGAVSLCYDADNSPCFVTYGKKIRISDELNLGDLIEILGNEAVLSDNNLVCGRKPGLRYEKSRFIFEADMIIRALSLPSYEKERVSGIVASLYFADAGLNTAALLDENGNIVEIPGITEISADTKSADKIIILTKESEKADTAGILERILTGGDNGILSQNLGKPQQYNLVLPDASGKVHHSELTKQDLTELITALQSADLSENVASFAADYGKYLGYGTSCCGCGYSGHAVNCFNLRRFKTLQTCGEKERYFLLTLYLCDNCNELSGAWYIKSLTIGGFSPFIWLRKIADADVITADITEIKLAYTEQTTYCDKASAGAENASESEILTVERELSFRLTPLMLAKMLKDNNWRE